MQSLQLMRACMLLHLGGHASGVWSVWSGLPAATSASVHSLPRLRAHPCLQGERLSSHMQVPRLKVRRDWFKGLKADPIDHSHPDVGNQPDAETGDVRAQQVGRECICLQLWCLTSAWCCSWLAADRQGLRVRPGNGTCWAMPLLGKPCTAALCSHQ